MQADTTCSTLTKTLQNGCDMNLQIAGRPDPRMATTDAGGSMTANFTDAGETKTITATSQTSPQTCTMMPRRPTQNQPRHAGAIYSLESRKSDDEAPALEHERATAMKSTSRTRTTTAALVDEGTGTVTAATTETETEEAGPTQERNFSAPAL